MVNRPANPHGCSPLQWGHLSLEVVIVRGYPFRWHDGELQWGHLTLEVVIRFAEIMGREPTAASMGPPLFRGGHGQQTSQPPRMFTASMGPPLFRGGHRQGLPLPLARRPASMGPPLFRGGHPVR